MTMVGVAVLCNLAFGVPWLIALMTGVMLNGISPSASIPLYIRMKELGIGLKKKIPESLMFDVPFDDLLTLLIFGIFLSVL